MVEISLGVRRLCWDQKGIGKCLSKDQPAARFPRGAAPNVEFL
jgi:hypothetical protein